MKKSGLCLLILGGILLLANPVMAQQSLAKTVADACKAEIEEYCSDVTASNFELLECLGAHGNAGKLSARCGYFLNDVSLQVARAMVAVSYVVNECSSDLDKHCTNVEAGEGRLVECLQVNDAEVSDRCKQARKDASVK